VFEDLGRVGHLSLHQHNTPRSHHVFLTWGTHFGDTNDPASMYSSPLCASLSTSSIFVATGIDCFSFCKPSLGPTSTMRTWSARLDAAEAKGLRWHGWRAARRAARRQTNLEDIAGMNVGGIKSACELAQGLRSGVAVKRCCCGECLRGTLHRGSLSSGRQTSASRSPLNHNSLVHPSIFEMAKYLWYLDDLFSGVAGHAKHRQQA
jgi:hypothetical protein